jgi:hypothetical protein
MSDLHDWGTGEAPQPTHSYPADPRPKWYIDPRTFDDLMQRAGPYADAAKVHVEYAAITAWLMKGQADKALEAIGLPVRVASLSVFLTRAAEERELGWPCLTSNVAPELYGYSPDSQCEARCVAAEVHALWEAAGRPNLGPQQCQFAHRYLVACVRKGTIPPVLTIGDVPLN